MRELVEERTQWIVEKQEKYKQELYDAVQDTRQELLERIYGLEERQEKYQEEVRTEFRHINQRFDTVVNMLLSFSLSTRKEE